MGERAVYMLFYIICSTDFSMLIWTFMFFIRHISSKINWIYACLVSLVYYLVWSLKILVFLCMRRTITVLNFLSRSYPEKLIPTDNAYLLKFVCLSENRKFRITTTSSCFRGQFSINTESQFVLNNLSIRPFCLLIQIQDLLESVSYKILCAQFSTKH